MTNPGETGTEDATLDPALETAVFGREVEHFINEDQIGRYLVERARAELEKAHQSLIDVNPTDASAIAALQLDARVANRVSAWLGEAIEAGRAAAVTIQQERDEHGR